MYRFLRRRYRQLIGSKSMTQERGKEVVQQHNVEDQRKIVLKVKNPNKKVATLRVMPPAFKPNNKIKLYTGNDISLQGTILNNDPSHKGKHHSGKNATRFNPTTSKLNPKGRLFYKGKEVAPHQSPVAMIDLNKQEKAYSANDLAASIHTPASVLDLTENDANQPPEQSRAPIFDLNQRLVRY